MVGDRKQRLVERLVTYTIEVDGRVYVIEQVPARVNVETGEQFFSPDTVSRVQQIIREGRSPARMIQKRMFDFEPETTIVAARGGLGSDSL